MDKLIEARQILGIEIEQYQVDLNEIQAIEVKDVISHKAREGYQLVEAPILVEDTGLYLDAWNGLPGALAKWFLKSVGNVGILKMLQPFKNRAAQAKTWVGFWNGEQFIYGRGEINGMIAFEERGENGFGWDFIFIPEGREKTFAEMTAPEKNAISMRREALEDLKKKIWYS